MMKRKNQSNLNLILVGIIFLTLVLGCGSASDTNQQGEQIDYLRAEDLFGSFYDRTQVHIGGSCNADKPALLNGGQIDQVDAARRQIRFRVNMNSYNAFHRTNAPWEIYYVCRYKNSELPKISGLKLGDEPTIKGFCHHTDDRIVVFTECELSDP